MPNALAHRRAISSHSSVALLALMSLAACECDRRVNLKGVEGELVLVAYSDSGEEQLAKDLLVDFGEVAYGERVKKTFSLRNRGTGTLTQLSLSHVQGDAFSLGKEDVSETDFYIQFEPTEQLSPLDEFPFTVEFAPGHVSDARVTEVRREMKLAVTSNGTTEEDSSVSLTISGMGRGSMCALPDEIDFGKVAVGTQVRASHVLRNALYAPAKAFVGSVRGSDALSFNQTSGLEGDIDLSAGASEAVEWVFLPSEARVYEAEVRMRAAGHCPEGTVRLRGEAVDQVLSWTPSQLDWGYVSPGSRVSQQVVFHNVGATPITLSKIQTSSPTEFSVNTGTYEAPESFVVPPGNVPTPLEVRCHPRSFGQKNAKLTFVTQLQKQPFGFVTLNCFGGGPNISVQPSPLLAMGAASYVPNLSQGVPLTRKLTIYNVGSQKKPGDLNGNLKLGQMNEQGLGQQPYFKLVPANSNTAESEFKVSLSSPYDPAVGLESTAGRNFVDVSVTLTPKSAGAKEAQLIVYSNDSDQPAYSVRVTAMAQELVPCQYSVSPKVLNFGVLAPSASKELDVVITNLGTQPKDVCQFSNLHVSAASNVGFELVGGPVASKELLPQQSVTYTVRAQASAMPSATVTPLTGALEFDVSHPTSPTGSVALNATVGPVCLLVSPDTLDFGRINKGCSSATRTFSIYNTCNENVTLTDIRWLSQGGESAGGPNCPGTQDCPEFVTLSSPAIPAAGWVMAPGSAPITFQARYTPLDIGVDFGSVAVTALQSGVLFSTVVNVTGASDGLGRTTDVFSQAAQPKADVLLTVDDSCSMFDKQNSLANNFTSFMSYAQASNVDFHLAVISTTDLDWQPGVNGSAGKFAGDANNPTVLTPQTPNLNDKFRTKVKLGIDGSIVEKGLATSTRALTPPLIYGHNSGFLRHDANLAVVVVTDAPDQSPEPVSQYFDRLLNIKGINRANMFTFNVIGPFMNAFLATCTYDSYADDGRYASIVAMSSGVKDEICNPNWATKLQAMGKTAFGFRQTFYLNSVPDLTGGKSLEVRLNGAILPNAAYIYDAVSNSITFHPNVAPGPGDTVSATYSVVCH